MDGGKVGIFATLDFTGKVLPSRVDLAPKGMLIGDKDGIICPRPEELEYIINYAQSYGGEQMIYICGGYELFTQAYKHVGGPVIIAYCGGIGEHQFPFEAYDVRPQFGHSKVQPDCSVDYVKLTHTHDDIKDVLSKALISVHGDPEALIELREAVSSID